MNEERLKEMQGSPEYWLGYSQSVQAIHKHIYDLVKQKKSTPEDIIVGVMDKLDLMLGETITNLEKIKNERTGLA